MFPSLSRNRSPRQNGIRRLLEVALADHQKGGAILNGSRFQGAKNLAWIFHNQDVNCTPEAFCNLERVKL